MKFKILFAFFLVFALQNSQGQVFVRPLSYHPTGEFGFVFNKSFSLELGYNWIDFDPGYSRWRVVVSGTFLKLKPRMDVFPLYGVLNGTSVFPEEFSYDKSSFLHLFMGSDFAFVNMDKMKVYAGLDIIFGAAAIDYRSKGYFVDEEYSGGGAIGGLRSRIGTQYELSEKIALSLSANRQVFIIKEPLGIGEAYDLGLGLIYNFEN